MKEGGVRRPAGRKAQGRQTGGRDQKDGGRRTKDDGRRREDDGRRREDEDEELPRVRDRGSENGRTHEGLRPRDGSSQGPEPQLHHGFYHRNGTAPPPTREPQDDT